MNNIRKYLPVIMVVLSLLSFTGVLHAQLSSASAGNIIPTQYSSQVDQDQVFVIYQTEGSLRPGDLTAVGPEPGNYDITWTQYDPAINAFTIPLTSELGVESSSIFNLEEGGYQAWLSNGSTVDTIFTAWIVYDNLKVALVKDDNGNVKIGESGCPDGSNWLIVRGEVLADDTMYYFDPGNGDTLYIENDYEILWTSDNPDLVIPNADNKGVVSGNRTEDPPYRDTWYILTATDDMGMVEVDSVYYLSKFTKAEFSLEYFDKVKRTWEESLGEAYDRNEGSMDAPLTVKFINESVNGASYRWVFIDSIDQLTQESFVEFDVTDDSTYTPEYTYTGAGKYYYPYLISTSEAGCIDTFDIEDDGGIHLVESELEIPNFFTPNGDQYNPNWMFYHQSIRSFKVTIFDRSGKVVYSEKVEDIYDWSYEHQGDSVKYEGWDGTINGKREAPEGQYFYVVEAEGYDNREFRDQNIIEKWRNNASNSTGTGTTGSEEEASLQRYTGIIYLIRERREL